MNETTMELLKNKMNERLASMRCVCFSDDQKKISFCSKLYHASIAFYEDSIVELSIQERRTKNSVFYLHFQVSDLQTAEKNIQVFFDFFEKARRTQAELNLPAVRDAAGMKILISCSSGFTSSYFAFLMQEALNQVQAEVKVDAVSSMELSLVQEQYDYILLAPQVAYRLEEFRRKYGEGRVLAIDTMDFSSRNVKGVMNWLLRVHAGQAA